jgi:serine/threonine protein kinase
MPWMPGSHLGQCEPIHTLGAGGMGEVWLAAHSRLTRQVAIKLLPTALTSDQALIEDPRSELWQASFSPNGRLLYFISNHCPL